MGQADLPVASGEKHAKAFQRAGWTIEPRRGRGKHFLLTKPGSRYTLSIPDHPEVKRALLSKQVKNADLTIAEYLGYFRK